MIAPVVLLAGSALLHLAAALVFVRWVNAKDLSVAATQHRPPNH